MASAGTSKDSFGARSTLDVDGRSYEIYRLDSLQARYDVARLPYTLRILLENVLRHGEVAEVEAVATWVAADETSPGYADRLAPLPTAVQLSWLRRNSAWRLVFERDGVLIFHRTVTVFP